MVDVYFNELSTDSSFINLPDSKNEAKDLLLGFIKTSLSYILAVGIDQNPVMLTHNSLPIFTSIQLYKTGFIKDLLLELRQENRISEIEKQKFQLFVNDSFSKEWEGEYRYNGKEVFGIGKTKEEDSFVISFTTNFNDNSYDWSHSQYLIEKTSQSGTITFDFERNIASPKHVFQKYNIWKSCKFKLNRPAQGLMPNIGMTAVIPTAFDCNGWEDFYEKYSNGRIDRSQCLKIAKILATVNGWDDIGKKKDNQWTTRDTYNAKNYYLQVDTGHAAYEVYKVGEKHIGEIRFNTNNVDTEKAKGNNRFIRL